MKKLFYSLIAITIMVSCTNQPEYKIDGNINGLNNGSAVLSKLVDKKLETVDSVAIENGVFTFKGSVTSPEYFVITLADTLDPIKLFLDNVDISINANIESIGKAIIEGSELTVLLNSFEIEIMMFDVRMRELYKEYLTLNILGVDSVRFKEIDKEYTELEDQKKEFVETFQKGNPNSLVSPYVALNYGNARYKNLEELEEMIKVFGEGVSDSKYLVEINNRISLLKNVAVGMKYTDFTMNDVDGNPVSLSSVAEGKYVLVDFWAGWCNPCRKESPLLVESYAKYKEKGFEIFAVSLDKTKESWVKAIEDDGITWTQVSELNYWNCSARDIYAFSSIPHNFLIDNEGIIIAKNIHDEELKAKLAELLN